MAWKTVRNNGIELQFPTGGSDSLRVVFDPLGHDIAYVVNDDRDNGNSNAALIAAAPELFSACRSVWDAFMEIQHGLPESMLLAAFECRSAVVKAMGGNGLSEDQISEAVARRRAQDRERQRRRRAKAKEATDGAAG